MMFRTHLALGFLFGLLSLKFFDLIHPVIFVVLVTLFSSLPDIDHPKSRIGRKLFFISFPIKFIFKHRGFFHSIFPPVILFLLLFYFNFNLVAFSVFIGYIAHLAGDAVTKNGINFLHPVTRFRIQGPIRTGGKFETIIFISLMLVNIAYVLKFI